MQATGFQYKLIKKIKDERFDEEKLHQYDLLIHLGARDFQVAVIDSLEQRLLWLEDYVLPNTDSHLDLMPVLDVVFDSHELLKAGFWNRIKVAVKNHKFVQVPDSLFIEEASADYLKFNASVDPASEDVLFLKNPRAEAKTVFAVQHDLREWFSKVYPTKQPIFLHQSACLIEGVLEFAANRSDNPLYLYIDRFRLHVMSCRDGRLVYYNQFAIKQFADYIKYIMLVMRSLDMDQQSSQVILWGYIGKNSPHYHEFYKYINNVAFGDRPAYLQFGYMFDEVQDHHFFDLYGMHLLGE
ncbi:MAG TPA: DUF3822 family protein [Cyclobacteriaceae bacterium]